MVNTSPQFCHWFAARSRSAAWPALCRRSIDTTAAVEVYDDRATRSKSVQGYAVPAFAVDRPYAAKKITGLSA